uniref:Immunoglobulin domain-containing protein n=1 Tax=Sinocyclocheilus anshuiensis TaxID=1608454 RepID=A0A671PY71_9TELE
MLSFLGISTQCHADTVNMSVQLEQNVTLPCFLNSSSEMAWYRLSSEKITLLISAARGNLKKKYLVTYYNENGSHFGLEADRRLDSVSLVIAGVRESDLGLYYCALGVSAKTMRFGTAVRLTFTLNRSARQRLRAAGRSWSVLVSYVGFAVFSACVCSVTGKVRNREAQLLNG